MDAVAYCVALVLATTFAWAGVAKLRDRGTTERTFRAFGLPAPAGLATAVPVAELGLAAGLVLVPGWAAVVALAVLAGFTTLLVRALRAGVDVGCGCFGTARSEPVSFVELVRNGVLALAAVIAATAPRVVVPTLESVVAVTTAAAVAALVLALCEVRRATGATFRVDLSGGPG
ncbi:MAG TPA: MauE/DoxX family redox-associated membrane protein [Acidimicrobiales bacterium]|nr:MauE/DoxX family redox-associated membrane protein [Acidimicrobiales bacterium]